MNLLNELANWFRYCLCVFQGVTSQNKFRIHFDPATRSLFESQTTVLQSIVRHMEQPESHHIQRSDAYLQGNRAALQVDRIRSQLTDTPSADYKSDFDSASTPAASVSTEIFAAQLTSDPSRAE